MKWKRGRTGQSIVEYIMIMGIVIVALFAMGPAIKRGTQSMVKATADQLGVQNKADQDFSPDGSALVLSTSRTQAVTSRNTQELIYTTNIDTAQSVDTMTTTLTNLGFSNE